MRAIKIGEICEFKGCMKRAEFLAQGRKNYLSKNDKTRHAEVGVFCEEHAVSVQEEGNPEYTTECPNCACLFGVN